MQRSLVGIPLMLAVGIAASPAPVARHAQDTRLVTGRVLQVGGVTPVASVHVMVRGERIGVSTNAHGRFELSAVPSGAVELVLRHPCYFPVYVALPAAGNATVAIGLPFDESSLRRAGCGGLGARSPDGARSNDSQ